MFRFRQVLRNFQEVLQIEKGWKNTGLVEWNNTRYLSHWYDWIVGNLNIQADNWLDFRHRHQSMTKSKNCVSKWLVWHEPK